MALEFVRIQRRIAVGLKPGLKFLAKLKKGKKVPMSQIYKDITDLSSLSRGDIKSVIDNLWLVITKYLKDGRDVDLEDFGEFKVSIHSVAKDTLEEVDANSIKRIKINFFIGKELRAELESAPKTLGTLEMKGYQPRKQVNP